MTKTITDTNWAVSAKNSLRNNNGFSANQLVFSKNLNYPTMETDLPPALENKTPSELVLENLNSLH